MVGTDMPNRQTELREAVTLLDSIGEDRDTIARKLLIDVERVDDILCCRDRQLTLAWRELPE